jgi:hypothetical protein
MCGNKKARRNKPAGVVAYDSSIGIMRASLNSMTHRGTETQRNRPFEPVAACSDDYGGVARISIKCI